MTVENYKTVDGVECVSWTDEQGTHSMTKEAYNKQQAEQSTLGLVNSDNPAEPMV